MSRMLPNDSCCLLGLKHLMRYTRQVGEHSLDLFLMCDSYVGCDQEFTMDLMVGAPGSEEESDEE